MTTTLRTTTGASTALLFATLVVVGCSTAPPQQPQRQTVAQIANRLVEVAEARADLRHIRAYVHEMNELSAADGRHATSAIATEIEHQLLLALHSRINVIDTQLSELGAASHADPLNSARSYHATHVLIGDYARDGDDLMVCLRLVDVESKVIVAASEGHIPMLALSDDARAASRTPVWRRPSYVWRGK